MAKKNKEKAQAHGEGPGRQKKALANAIVKVTGLDRIRNLGTNGKIGKDAAQANHVFKIKT